VNPDATHPSLLSRLRDRADGAAWREFEQRYRELLVRFCRSRGLQIADAEDVVQAVMTNISQTLVGFRYDPAKGRFRDYLYRATRNAITRLKSRPNPATAALDTSADASVAEGGGADPQSDGAWEREWVAHHYRIAMETIRRTFDPRSVEVFERNMGGMSVAALGAAYGLSEQAVHKVRQRIRARMEELITAQVREEDGLDD
jgi:RNA polymerase sigma-70 factor (ECF subfamily)